jgi:hypothetical protein
MNKTFAVAVLLSLIMTSLAYAERFKDNIHSISKGKHGEDHILKLASGRIAFVDPADNFSAEYFQAGLRVELEIDEKLTLKSIFSLSEPPLIIEDDSEEWIEDEKNATVLVSEIAVNNIFRGLNRSWRRDTECSDRAHIWSYEEWRKSNLISSKAFLFFTNTYIRAYRWHWWFHVAPYTLVQNQGSIGERVLDPRFLQAPVSMKSWTDFFIKSNRACPVTSYGHFEANRNSLEHCFVVKSSMYYRLPIQIRTMENLGQTKTSFNNSEINFSYRAFTRRY